MEYAPFGQSPPKRNSTCCTESYICCFIEYIPGRRSFQFCRGVSDHRVLCLQTCAPGDWAQQSSSLGLWAVHFTLASLTPDASSAMRHRTRVHQNTASGPVSHILSGSSPGRCFSGRSSNKLEMTRSTMNHFPESPLNVLPAQCFSQTPKHPSPDTEVLPRELVRGQL